MAAVSSAAADEVRLTADLPEARFSLNGQNFVISSLPGVFFLFFVVL